jgi:hypothetical protein
MIRVNVERRRLMRRIYRDELFGEGLMDENSRTEIGQDGAQGSTGFCFVANASFTRAARVSDVKIIEMKQRLWFCRKQIVGVL